MKDGGRRMKHEGIKAICGVLLTDVLTDGWTFVIVESLLWLKKGAPITLLEAFFQIKLKVKFVSVFIPNTNAEENQKNVYFLEGPKHPPKCIFSCKSDSTITHVCPSISLGVKAFRGSLIVEIYHLKAWTFWGLNAVRRNSSYSPWKSNWILCSKFIPDREIVICKYEKCISKYSWFAKF